MESKIVKVYNIANNFINRYLSRFYENTKIDKALFFFLILLIGVGMYILNHYTTLIVDDYNYSFSLGHRTTGIMDIFQSQYNHYFTWGGRVVVHTIAQFFLMYDKAVFDIANTVAYLAMILTVYFHAVGKIKFYPFLLLLINLLFFLCMPAFGQVFLWVVGACNYLWGPLLVFLYLVPYRLQYSRETPVISSKLLSIIFGMFGVIAGWTNENLGLTLAFVIAVFMFLYWNEHRKVYLWCIFGLIGAAIGAIALILAPGNMVRMQVGNFEVNIIKNFFNVTRMFLKSDYLLLPNCIMVILFILSSKKTDYKLLFLYIIGLFVSMYAMVGAPFYADRAKLGSLIFSVIACCYLYQNIDLNNFKVRKIFAVLTVAMISMTISEYTIAKNDIRDYKLRNDKKIEHVLKEKSLGNLDIIVEPEKQTTRYAAPDGLEDISDDITHWTNTGFAKYYEIRTVRVEPDKYRLAKELR